ncbi:hypothetical protein SNE40_008330 [Patella caerulea]|uniref:Farnesoic acid O-methyl transferase domain-containing protein n=1 Tax=Patella caerulea TaxID=87958 RepID=A0AAN8K1N4_PATCE
MEHPCIRIWVFTLIHVCFGLRAYTPDDKNYAFPLARKGFIITNITQLTFQVKACGNAHIFLQENEVADLDTDGNWVFALGSWGNSRSEIIASVTSHSRFATHLEVLMDCNEFRPFWIRWAGGLLELGKGSEYGIDTMSVHAIPPLELNYAFILTGWGSDGCWNIDMPETILVSGWTVSANKKLLGSNVKSYRTKSQQRCGYICMTPTEDLPCGCVEYSYNTLTKQCLVVDESETSVIVTATGWRTWQLM